MTDSVFCRSRIALLPSLFLGIAITALVGCSGTTKTVGDKDGEEPKPAGPMKLLVVGDEPLAAAIKRQWQASSEGELVVESVDASSLLGEDAKAPRADIIVYPPALMGDLVQRRFLTPIPQETLRDKQWKRDDVFPLEY